MRRTLAERIFRRVTIDPSSGCWLWTGALSDGYGKVGIPGTRRTTYVHIAVYEMFHGPVPHDRELHHGCETKRCCHPDHTHPEVHRVHTADLTPSSQSYLNKRKTHCRHGHALTDDNVRPSGKGRQCATCHRERAARYYENHREERQEYAREWRAGRAAAGQSRAH